MLLARTSRARWLADPSQVPPTRLFTVHLLTPAVYSEYATNFDAFMQHYYSRTSNHTVLLVSPQAHLKDALDALSPMLGIRYSVRSNHAIRSSSTLLAWRHRSTNFLLQGIEMSVPERYNRMQATCGGRNWTQDYALYSGAIFVAQLLWQPILDRATFYLKCDTDVRFVRPVPYDLSQRLGELSKRVVLAHTGFEPGNNRDCERGIFQALASFREGRIQRSHGGTKEMAHWCLAQKTTMTFYGNFLAFRAAWMRSTPIQRLSRYLYYERGEGYFQHRWGDQASPLAFLCHTLSKVALAGDERIVHLQGLRCPGAASCTFRHGRAKRLQVPVVESR